MSISFVRLHCFSTSNRPADYSKNVFGCTWLLNLLLQMDNVLSEYKYDYKKNKIHGQPPTMAEPAVWSILNLLHLIPFFTVHSPQLDIDADTGYFTAAFETAEQGVFSVLITDKNEVHCSWAEEGFNIVKFTGTFKIRDKRDFLKFKKILSIL